MHYDKKVNHVIYPKYNLFISKASEEITFDDLHAHVLDLMSDEYFSAGINGLYDFSKVTKLSGDLEKWRVLAEGMSSEEVIIEKAKTAIVLPANNPSLHSIMEGYLIMTSGSLIDYKLFEPSQWQPAMNHVYLTEFTDLSDFEKKAVSA